MDTIDMGSWPHRALARKATARNLVRRGCWRMLALIALTVPVSRLHAECKVPAELQIGASTAPTPEAYTAIGTWFANQQQFACADDAFRSALKLDPSSAKLNYFLGLSLFSEGQIEAAVAPLEQSIKSDTKAIPPRLLLATSLHQLGRRSEAEAQWHAVLEIDPAQEQALDGLANSLTDGGDPTLAIRLLSGVARDEALTLDLARAYGIAGILDQAAQTLQDALSADPASLPLTNALTTVLVHQHRYQDAAALMQRYTQQHPDNVEAQIGYFSALVLNSDTETARPLGKKLLTLAPHDFQVIYLNGILEREAGEYAAAREHLLEAVKQQPDNYSARFNLGVALAHLNDPAGAEEQLQKAVALDGSQQQAHFQLAGVLRTLGDTQAAQEQLNAYKQLSNESTAHSQADTRARLAADKLASGDAKQAVVLYQQAIEATPDDAMLQFQLSQALAQTGDSTGERAALEQTVKIDPTFALAQNQLGYLLSREGKLAEAEKSFRAAAVAAPAFSDAWINLAATLAQESHFSDAREAVVKALQLEPDNSHAKELAGKLDEVLARK